MNPRSLRAPPAASLIGAALLTLVLPAYPPLSGGLTAQQSLRVAAYNIRHGRGTDGRVDLERVARVLAALDADVIALQEVDDRTERTGGVDQVSVLAGLLGYAGFHGPHRAYQGGFYGNALLSRLPIDARSTVAIPTAGESALAVAELVVEVQGFGPVSVVSVHLAGTPEERMAQADSLARAFGRRAVPVVLAGDFNGRPDDDVLRRLASSWTMAPKGGAPHTYPAADPDREIDYVMWRDPGDGRGRLVLREHRVVDEPLASDHRPILADFELRPGGDSR